MAFVICSGLLRRRISPSRITLRILPALSPMLLPLMIMRSVSRLLRYLSASGRRFSGLQSGRASSAAAYAWAFVKAPILAKCR